MSKKFETPKGTRDFLPDDMRLRQAVFAKLRECFEVFGYEELDTPVFEYLEVLTLKAGPQAENEIYSFEDKGGRRLGLRFDLTSSTGRVAANHPELKRPIYRYQIGKVWRYDRPAAGRYREFYQADVDIIGSYSMNCEVELMMLADFVLKKFGLEHAYFLVNHRQILDAQLRITGIKPEQKSLALRALDKLDKIGRNGVIEEAVQYGVPRETFNQFLTNILDSKIDNNPSVDRNENYFYELEHLFSQDELGLKATSEIRYLFSKAKELGFEKRLILDPTLARGLDYYTGPIFEARAMIKSPIEQQQSSSFAGGGRYNDLIGLYGGQDQGAVGFSFGVERLIELIKSQPKEEQEQHLSFPPRPILIAALAEPQMVAAEKMAQQLRMQGIVTRLAVQPNSPGKHLQYAEATGIDFVIFVGEKEVTENKYPLKQLSTRTEKYLTMEEIQIYLRTKI